MSIFKNKKSERQNLISTSTMTSDMINFNELNFICNQNLKGLLKAYAQRDNQNNIKIKYVISNFVTLKDLLVGGIDSNTFAAITRDIWDTLNKLLNSGLKVENLNIDTENIMVDLKSNSVYFLYLPLLQIDTSATVRKLVLNILNALNLKGGDKGSIRQSLMDAVYCNPDFSVSDLFSVLNEKPQNKEAEDYIVCPKCSYKNDKGMNFCVSCGAKLKDINEGYKEPEFLYNPPVRAEKTYLIRKKTGEKYFLDKDVVIVGKSDECDCVVSGNNAISRRHAQFIKYSGRYYINDLNSTNKTYVMGNEVKHGIRTEVHRDDTVRLANEDFIFTIE